MMSVLIGIKMIGIKMETMSANYILKGKTAVKKE